MRRDTRDRLVLPILIPVGAFLVIGMLVVGFSRILLSVRPMAATVTATIVAAGILVTAARVATLKRVRATSLVPMVAIVAGVAMVAGGIAVAAIGPEEEPERLPTIALAAPPGASGEGFDKDRLDAPANEPFVIAFNNQEGGVQHNVVINEGEEPEDPELFRGPLVTGPGKAIYEIEALHEGPHFFFCEVHPQTMTGTLEAIPRAPGGEGGPPGEGGPGEGGGPPGGGGNAVTVTAQALQFSTDTLSLPADTDVQLTFENQDPDPHNLTIYAADPASDPGAERLFFFEFFPGPATKEFTIPPLQPGSYFFKCDVHPQMNGTVSVA